MTDLDPSATAPPGVLALATARADARRRRDWSEADRLKAEIEALDWRVIDSGTEFHLVRAQPLDVVVDGVPRYGAAASVPSRLDEPDEPGTTVVIAATEDDASALARTVEALIAHAPADTSVVVVADMPGPALEAALASLAGIGPRVELIRSGAPLGRAGALNAGLRRATGRIVAWLEPGAIATGDFVSVLVAALDDPAVAVAGWHGRVSGDLLHYRDGTGLVTVVGSACLAFRRADGAAAGPIDEHLGSGPLIGAWWSLALRDAGPGRAARHAVAVPGLPIEAARANDRRPAREPDPRHARRNAYRVRDRFHGRPDLATPGA